MASAGAADSSTRKRMSKRKVATAFHQLVEDEAQSVMVEEVEQIKKQLLENFAMIVPVKALLRNKETTKLPNKDINSGVRTESREMNGPSGF